MVADNTTEIDDNEIEETYYFPLERQGKYKARISFQPLYIIPVTEGAMGALSDLANKDGNVSASENNLKKINDFEKSGKIDKEVANSYRASIQRQQEEEDAIQKLEQENGLKKLEGSKDIGSLKFRPLKKHCYLYAPAALAFNDAVNIGNASLGMAGAAALGTAGAGSSIMGSILKGVGAAGKSAIDAIIGTAAGSSGAVARVGTQRLAQKIPNEGLQSAATIGLQVRSNPNQRSVFEGVAMRSFSFAFKFVPLSGKEADEIEKIIRFFRKQLYPEHIMFGETGIPFGYKFPNMFRIKIQYEISPGNFKEMPNMEILPCYLASVSTTFNSSSMTFHEGGKPTETDLSLSFSEYRTVHKRDITHEYQGRDKIQL
jgi:hypothetical protein